MYAHKCSKAFSSDSLFNYLVIQKKTFQEKLHISAVHKI